METLAHAMGSPTARGGEDATGREVSRAGMLDFLRPGRRGAWTAASRVVPSVPRPSPGGGGGRSVGVLGVSAGGPPGA